MEPPLEAWPTAWAKLRPKLEKQLGDAELNSLKTTFSAAGAKSMSKFFDFVEPLLIGSQAAENVLRLVNVLNSNWMNALVVVELTQEYRKHFPTYSYRVESAPVLARMQKENASELFDQPSSAPKSCHLLVISTLALRLPEEFCNEECTGLRDGEKLFHFKPPPESEARLFIFQLGQTDSIDSLNSINARVYKHIQRIHGGTNEYCAVLYIGQTRSVTQPSAPRYITKGRETRNDPRISVAPHWQQFLRLAGSKQELDLAMPDECADTRSYHFLQDVSKNWRMALLLPSGANFDAVVLGWLTYWASHYVIDHTVRGPRCWITIDTECSESGYEDNFLSLLLSALRVSVGACCSLSQRRGSVIFTFDGPIYVYWQLALRHGRTDLSLKPLTVKDVRVSTPKDLQLPCVFALGGDIKVALARVANRKCCLCERTIDSGILICEKCPAGLRKRKDAGVSTGELDQIESPGLTESSRDDEAAGDEEPNHVEALLSTLNITLSPSAQDVLETFLTMPATPKMRLKNAAGFVKSHFVAKGVSSTSLEDSQDAISPGEQLPNPFHPWEEKEDEVNEALLHLTLGRGKRAKYKQNVLIGQANTWDLKTLAYMSVGARPIAVAQLSHLIPVPADDLVLQHAKHFTDELDSVLFSIFPDTFAGVLLDLEGVFDEGTADLRALSKQQYGLVRKVLNVHERENDALNEAHVDSMLHFLFEQFDFVHPAQAAPTYSFKPNGDRADLVKLDAETTVWEAARDILYQPVFNTAFGCKPDFYGYIHGAFADAPEIAFVVESKTGERTNSSLPQYLAEMLAAVCYNHAMRLENYLEARPEYPMLLLAPTLTSLKLYRVTVPLRYIQEINDGNQPQDALQILCYPPAEPNANQSPWEHTVADIAGPRPHREAYLRILGVLLAWIRKHAGHGVHFNEQQA